MSRRRINRTAAVAGMIGSAALGAAVLAPAANAQGTGEDVGPLASLGTASQIPGQMQPGENELAVQGGYGLCFQWAKVSLDPGGYPDSTLMAPEANSIGLGDCTQDIVLEWKNLDSGETGSKAWTATGPGSISGVPHPYEAIVGTGAGKVEFTLEAEKSGARSDTITLDVPAYQG